MLNLDEINKSIEDLEKGTTSYPNCQKLASLYICRDHLKNVSEGITEEKNEVIEEYSDILPEYNAYCSIKRKYQMHELTEQAVEQAMKNVCKEIREFIETLFFNTEFPKERLIIKEMIKELQKIGE